MRMHILLILIVASLLIAACVPVQTVAVAPTPAIPMPTETAAAAVSPAPAAEVVPADVSVIPVEALMNATYSGIYDEPVTLTEGLYEGAPFVEGDASRPTVEYINGVELNGDLDGDGVDDAVVFLLERGGGSGAFTYVAAQHNRDGKPVDAGAVWIEDRIGVRSAAIENGQVVLDIIMQGPGDAACCGSHKAHKTYALQEGRLVETTVEGGELVRVSSADLDGTAWTLLQLGEGKPALPDAEVTIRFGDGQISGSGGCNSYNSSFNLGKDNPFVMTTGPVVATQKSCPDPIGNQEIAYLAALENVSRWGYVFGKLTLYYADGTDGESRLLFAPQAASETVQADTLTGQTGQWVSFTNPVEQFDLPSEDE
jgi:heat shock protein HslJ